MLPAATRRGKRNRPRETVHQLQHSSLVAECVFIGSSFRAVGGQLAGRNAPLLRTATPDPSPLLLLITDDDESRQSTIRQTLRRAGYALAEASTAADAHRLAQIGPSLIILGSQRRNPTSQ